MKHVSFPFVLTWSDLCFVWRKHRRWMLGVALVCALMGMLVALFTPMRYKAKALFREGNANAGFTSSLHSFVSSMTNHGGDGSGIVVMQTDQVIRHVVQELGLQVQIEKENLICSYLQCAHENIFLFCGGEPIERDDFVFSDVQYTGRKPLCFSFVFSDERHFAVYDHRGSILAKAALGEKVSLSGVAFTLVQRASNFVVGKRYRAQIYPLQQGIGDILKNLEIRSEKLDKSLLRLFYSHPSREQASKILDCIMKAYLQYLQEENDRVAQKQLEFLDKRQEQFTRKFEQELNEYIGCLQQNISAYGFFEAEQQLELLTLPQQELKSKLIELDSLLERLKTVQTSYDYVTKNEPPTAFEQPVQIIPAWDCSSSSSPQPFAMPKWQKNRAEQFAGIDLDTAKALHVTYQKEVDEWQEKIDTLGFLLQRIHRKDFDLDALGILVHDQVTAKLVNSASELALQLKDVGNRSQKDLLRIDESLAVQKTFIAQHLRQSLELYKQNAFIGRQKLASLRDVMMLLVEGEKAVIYKKLQEIQGHLAEVPVRWKLEKQMEVKGEVMRKIIESLTQATEGKTLDYHLKQLSSKIIDSAYSFSRPERKSFVLFIVISIGAGLGISFLFFFCRYLLRGFPLTESTARALELVTAGSLGPFCDAPFQELAHNDMGTLRSLADFIQRKKRAANEGIVVALTGSKHPPFARNLARLLTMRENRTLLVDASFDFAQSQVQTNTLWDYLTEKSATWQTHRNDGFDVLSGGGTGRFCAELLHKDRFAQLLAKARCEYDTILMICTDVFASNEWSCILEKMDAFIATMQEETVEQLNLAGLVQRLRQPESAIAVFHLFN